MLVSESENDSGGTIGEDWEQPQKQGDGASGGKVDSGGDVDPLGDLKHVGPIRSCASMLLQYLHTDSSLEINCCTRACQPVAIHVHIFWLMARDRQVWSSIPITGPQK